jgi:hypothetical protein
MNTLKLLLIMLLLVVSGCKKGKNNTPRLDLGQIEDNRLNEISGMDNSQINKDVFWLHNDSGDSAQIFAIDKKGKHLGKFMLKNIENRDWEDIAVGPGPINDQSYIYIGDIGDNEAIYDVKYIYRIKEPRINFDKIPFDSSIQDVETITYKYPDGPRDAETLMIDPLTKNLIIVSKREESVHVYVLLFPQNTDSIIIPQQIASLPITQVTGGDISNSGKKIILKNYEIIYYWIREQRQSLQDAFSQLPDHLPYIVEPQGEAICWSNDEKGYFTTSEEADNIEAQLYFYPFK